MTKFSFFSLGVIASVLFSTPLPGFFGLFSRGDSSDHVDAVLHRAVYEEAFRPNKWGYVVNPMYFLHVSADQLKYEISAVLDVTNKCQTVEDAEELYVSIYRDFANRLNSIQIIRPYLGEFPLTPDSLRIALGFVDFEGKSYLPPFIGCVNTWEGFLRFNYYTTKPVWTLILEKPVHSVPELERLYTDGVPRKKDGPKPVIPTYYYHSRGAPSFNEIFAFSRNFAKAHNLEPVAGTVSKPNEDRPFQFGFRGSQLLSLHEARKLIAACAKEMLSFAQNNERTVAYIKKRKTWTHEKFVGDIPEKDHIALRMSFWDEYVNRQPAPYIAEIRVAGESFKYYTADEGQRLVLVYEETWEDAMKFFEQNSQPGS